MVYPQITPAWSNLTVDSGKINKQDDSRISPDNYSHDAALPQSDRLIITDDYDDDDDEDDEDEDEDEDDSVPPRSASSSSSLPSSSNMPFKKRYVKTTYNDSPIKEDNKENDGIDQPIYTSTGKVKKYRCRPCQFVAIIKRNFWNHKRIHIKPEKLLTCTECPFVTEYKHHLNFHELNHRKSKPFKCDECDYSGVCKSMLDSHLKSHSVLRQYCCAECNFATKFSYQLKMHLKKLKHEKGFVLNQDGTFDPENLIIPTKDAKKKKTRSKRLQKLPALVDSLPAAPVKSQCNDVNVLPTQFNDDNVLPKIVPTTPFSYVPMFTGYHVSNAFAIPAADFVDDQIVSQVYEFVEQPAPIDYSQRSPTLSSPPCEQVESPIDLTDNTSVPLDLRKIETPTSIDDSQGWSVELNYTIKHTEEDTADLQQQIQHLRTSLQTMQKYLWTLEHNVGLQ